MAQDSDNYESEEAVPAYVQFLSPPLHTPVDISKENGTCLETITHFYICCCVYLIMILQQ